MAGSGSRKKEGRRQLAEAEPSRQSHRVANLGVEPHRPLEGVERDTRKANAERRNELLAQEGVTSGSAVQDAHQVSKSDGQETALNGAGVSMSADSKLGPDDEDMSVPDASAQASVRGADVVEPPVGGRGSDSPQPEHEVEASDDDEVEYVGTKKPHFDPADDVEVVEVDSDPDDDDDELELMKVEPAVRKEAHISTVQEDQVLEDMEVSSLKSSGTASIRTPVQARTPPAPPGFSAEVQVKAFMADQVRRWERGVSETSFPQTPIPAKADVDGDGSGRLDRRDGADTSDVWSPGRLDGCDDSSRTLLPSRVWRSAPDAAVRGRLRILELGPGWFRTQANKAHPDLVRNVVEEMLILLTIEMVELRQLLVRAVEIQVSAHAEQPRPKGIVLEPDVEMSDREVELLGRDYVRMLKVSGLQKSRSPRGPSVGEPGLKRIQRVPALAPPSSIPTPESPQSVSSSAFRSLEGARPGSMSSVLESSVKSESEATSSLFGTTGGSDESLTSVTSGSRTSRDSSSGSSGFSWGQDAGGHMSAVPMAMTARTLFGDTAVGPAIAMYVTQETLPSNPVQVDQDDVTMSESSRSQARGRKSKSFIRRYKRTSPSPFGRSSSKESHRRLGSSRRSLSERSYRSGRSRASASSGSTQVALNAMYQVQEAVARMEIRQDPTLEKQNARLDLEVARRFGPRGQGASEKPEDVPSQADDARVRGEAETQEAARLEAVRLDRERADALLAQNRAQTEAHQAEEARRVTTMVESMQQELEHVREERARERETAKNVQTFLREQLRNIRTTYVQTTPRPVTSQPDLATSRPILYPESSGVINDDVIMGEVGRLSTNLDELLAAQLRATLDVAPKTGAAPTRVKTESAPRAPARKRPDVRSERKVATEGETRRGAQPDAAKRARPANAKSAERKGRNASSQNNKSKKTPKYRGSSDNSDSDSSSGSSDQDSKRSDSSSFEDVVPNVPTVTGPGGTMFTFRPYVNASALEDFDEKASVAVRTRWLERFHSIAVQGGWTDMIKIYEMKLKLSAAVRNWRANLRPKVRRDWKKFLKEFREMYCKAKTSDSERYYTMMQRKSDSPLEFYYRLNKVADKAGIDFDSSSKQRERHLKMFTTKLLDSRLRKTLQGQRIRKLRNLAYVLKQHEEMTQGDDYDGPPPKRDFRADNVSHGRFQPKRSGRALVIQDEDSPDEDDREVRFQDLVEEVPNVPSAVIPVAGSTQPGSDSGKDGSQAQDISSAVFRIIENSGWRPPPNGKFRPAPRSPRFEDRDRTKFCERCNDFGHSTESCWSVLKCDHCGRKGHPARLCGVRPCSFCKKFHEDQCGEWKKFQAVKTLARQVTLTSPLDGDPERVGLKTTPELCVLVYVGPELRSRSQDNHQCMTVISENEEYLSVLPRPDQLHLEEDCPDNNDRDDPPEFRLGPGQRYGWWEEHNPDETKKVAMVHGAVNNCRTDILLDSGASVSMMSLDLARRFKLRLKFCKQLRVSGLGGVPTIITATTEVKTTLGPRVVYVMELWVANIGEGVDVLLGMNFMYFAGVRLCAREGLVKLPDEETVLLAGRTAGHMGHGLDLAITPKTCLYLGPGESAVVRIDYGQSNPQREVVWAGRGDRWVTQIIYAAKSWPVAVKVANISDKTSAPRAASGASAAERGAAPSTGLKASTGRAKDGSEPAPLASPVDAVVGELGAEASATLVRGGRDGESPPAPTEVGGGTMTETEVSGEAAGGEASTPRVRRART
ncbi:unnamed protein product [Phytophthora fragariaefolia]|uniref:Unnamed protein product n=1 Tax=Phytophthora fragariaefolia TaxID=1490495 RepID=A0A9W7CXW0_9STRA|nr:unnamed protein product [Phytophthora fragariaefolia]